MRRNSWKQSLRLARLNRFTFIVLAGFALGGCSTTAKPPALQAPEFAAPPPAPSLATPVDNIPADASPAIRAHLIKLKEMLQAGQISQADYDSRRTLLLSR